MTPAPLGSGPRGGRLAACGMTGRAASAVNGRTAHARRPGGGRRAERRAVVHGDARGEGLGLLRGCVCYEDNTGQRRKTLCCT